MQYHVTCFHCCSLLHYHQRHACVNTFAARLAPHVCAGPHASSPRKQLNWCGGRAGGLPIGAVLVTDAVADVMKPGDHGSTFAGNPLVCRTAEAVLDVRPPTPLSSCHARCPMLRARSCCHCGRLPLHAHLLAQCLSPPAHAARIVSEPAFLGGVSVAHSDALTEAPPPSRRRSSRSRRSCRA